MAKVYPLKNDNGVVVAYGFTCPGCGCDHAITILGQRAWSFNGDVNKPTFTPSLLVFAQPKSIPPGPRCHSFIREGKIQFLGDCEHALANQTVDLPDVESNEKEQ